MSFSGAETSQLAIGTEWINISSFLYKGDELRFTYNEENSDWWWRSTEYQNYLKPLQLLPSMPEVSIDDANKVIIAEMERRGSSNSKSKLPNPALGKNRYFSAYVSTF